MTAIAASFSDVCFYSVAAIAKRWALSVDKVTSILERYRSQDGFYDFGRPDRDTKRHVRKYSIIRVSPDLLAKIERAL